jgi:hypothetical protein
MPAVTNQIDWAGIRANSVSIGIRAAARAAAANLPDIERERFVNRALQRAHREGWTEAKQAAVSSIVVRNEKPLSSNVINGADSIAKAIAEDSEASRAAILKTVRKGSEHLRDKEGEYIVENAKNVQQLASAGNVAGKWNEREGDDRRVMINIGILAE